MQAWDGTDHIQSAGGAARARTGGGWTAGGEGRSLGDGTGNGDVGGEIGPFVGKSKRNRHGVAGADDTRARRIKGNNAVDAQQAGGTQFDGKVVAGAVQSGLHTALYLQVGGSGVSREVCVQTGIDGDAGATIGAIAAKVGGVRCDDIVAVDRSCIDAGKESILRTVERALNRSEAGAGGHWEACGGAEDADRS